MGIICNFQKKSNGNKEIKTTGKPNSDNLKDIIPKLDETKKSKGKGIKKQAPISIKNIQKDISHKNNESDNTNNKNENVGVGETIQKKKHPKITDIDENKNNKIPDKNQNMGVRNSYSTLTGDKYYLVCPDCKERVPEITNFQYDTDENDFIIFYNCDCNKSDNNSKNEYLIKFYNTKKPRNSKFISEEMATKIYETAKENEEKFTGFKIFDKYRNELVFNRTVAPPPLLNNISVNKSNININKSIKYSKIIGHKVEKSENYELTESNNKAINKISTISRFVSVMNQIEEENESMKKYKCYNSWQGHTDKIVSLIELDSQLIATGSHDKKIIVWKIDKDPMIFKEIETNGIINCLLEFEKDKILFGNKNIGLWNLVTQDISYDLYSSGYNNKVNCLAKCDNNYFASSSNDGNIRIWDYYNKNEVKKIMAHKGDILCLILLSNGNLCSGAEDLSIKFWDWEKGECIVTIPDAHDETISCLFELENGDIMSGSSDKSIKIWKDENPIRNIDSHEEAIGALCQIDNNYIVSASFDKKIKIWNLNNLECFQTLSEHEDKVSCLIKMKNNNNLVSCSYDGIIKIWKND